MRTLDDYLSILRNIRYVWGVPRMTHSPKLMILSQEEYDHISVADNEEEEGAIVVTLPVVSRLHYIYGKAHLILCSDKVGHRVYSDLIAKNIEVELITKREAELLETYAR